MTEQSERIPVSNEYLQALGRATYNFASSEWGIVWLMETIRPGFLKTASGLTAGMIAKQFLKAVERLDDTVPDKDRLRALGHGFNELIQERNGLLHGNPYTAPGGEQRLLYDGKNGHRDWSIEAMREFASRAATVSIEANSLLHDGRLQQYVGARA